MNHQLNSLLVVEDNDLDVEKLQRSLARLDVATPIVRARDGLEALDRLRGTNQDQALPQPCLILLDLNMPRMNGIEFLAELRADPELNKLPVIVLTTSDRNQDISEAYKHNVSGYILKPSKLKQMQEALSTVRDYWNLCQYPANGY